MSDNGTNFVGAEKVQREELKKIDEGKIYRAMSQKGIKWMFIEGRSLLPLTVTGVMLRKISDLLTFVALHCTEFISGGGFVEV